MRSRRASPVGVARVNPPPKPRRPGGPRARDPGPAQAFSRFDLFVELEPRQKYLLRALVQEGAAARGALASWLAAVDLDAIGNPESRLIPTLMARFGDELRGHPRYARLEGTYRYWQLRNSLMLADGRRALERLRDAGVQPVLFKGVAMALKYYASAAERPMGDLDVLVRPAFVERAQGALLGAGWRLARSGPGRGSDVHARDFVNANRCGFDLHWHSLYESPFDGLDAGVRERSVAFDWAGLQVRLMAPVDLLLCALVNGIRVGGPLPLQWIVDAARILAAGPIEWSVLWAEAGQRGVRLPVFEALNVVRDVHGALVPEALLRGFVAGDPALHRELLATALAEGRVYGLDERHREPAAAIAAPAKRARRAPRGASGDVAAAPQQVRLFRDASGAITRLFIQRRHLARLGELFEVRDAAWLASLGVAGAGSAFSFVDVPPGKLAPRSPRDPWDYQAAITVEGTRALRLAPGEARRVRVVVQNRSQRCWAAAADPCALLGVSYHLHAAGGELLAQDLPRTYVLHARGGHAAFVEPGQKVACEVTVVAPETPGSYRLRLDLVQEHVAWFSHHGCTFPELQLEVRKAPQAPCHVAGGPGIVHVPRDGETVIVDTLGGRYFTASGYGPAIWNALLERRPTRQIAAAFAAAGIARAGPRIVEPFIAELVREGLASPCAPRRAAKGGGLGIEPLPGVHRAILTRHPEPATLMALHPLGGASPRSGWPAAREAPSPANAAAEAVSP